MSFLNNSFIRNVNSLNTLYLIIWRRQTTFYDVLRLKKDCTSKDIKDSYIKLSKKYHPDKTKNSENAHQQFIKINEAYNTLSKPHLRRSYDLELENPYRSVQHNFYNQAYDTTIYENSIFKRYKSQTNDEEEYYGVKGIKRQPHYIIVFLCIGFALIGLVIQLAIVKNAYMLGKDKLKKDHEENEMILAEVRSKSELNGRELQIELLRKRFEQEEEKRKSQFK